MKSANRLENEKLSKNPIHSTFHPIEEALRSNVRIDLDNEEFIVQRIIKHTKKDKKSR